MHKAEKTRDSGLMRRVWMQALALVICLAMTYLWVTLGPPTHDTRHFRLEDFGTIVGVSSGAADPYEWYLHIPYERHTGRSGRIRALSAIQDHRNHGPVENLHEQSRPWGFLERSPDQRVIQFHLALPSNVTFAQPPETFDRIELWLWRERFSSADEGRGDYSLIGPENISLLEEWVRKTGIKLHPKKCFADMPLGYGWRMRSNVEVMEWVARCLWEDFEELFRSARSSGGDAAFVIYAAFDVALFPLDEVLHYPHPVRPLNEKLAVARQSVVLNRWSRGREGAETQFPTAPWRKDPRFRDVLRSIKRVDPHTWQGLPVAAATLKKNTWNNDDELWLLWMLDVIGIDHMVVYISTTQLAVEAVRQRLQQRHPQVLEHLTLVNVETPPAPIAFDFLTEVLVFDFFLRWQTHFEFSFILDADEFVQLFSPDPPYERIDIKTFITHHADRIKTNGLHANLDRLRVERTRDNDQEEPGLLTFLLSLLTINGKTTDEFISTNDIDGSKSPKSLFWVPGSITPYMHCNNFFDVDIWNLAEAHMLHIRQDEGTDITLLQAKLDDLPSSVRVA